MPISRDARMDRRRRLLRDAVEADSVDNSAPRRTSRRLPEADDPDGLLPKRKAGYSQDVRRACGQRLVQLIPVRRRSFAAVIFISLLIPGLLLAAHYLIHVTGQLQWWRHPLAVALDIGHPRSIAAWLSSQLWLLCLGATVLTFQLRRHKLDDYNGEYRLWFWLVLTCLVASVDATTSITELFALALDPWAQSHLGWSGPAVVDVTLTMLIGMLGLRMCSELKVVPLSLVWWLCGLVAWACSAALARPEFKLELSAPIRYWLISAFWLGGLTSIWLSALTYLRCIYVEAQQRFLLRGRLAASGVPLGQRLRESLPNLPRFGRAAPASDGSASVPAAPGSGPRWSLPGLPAFMRRGGAAPLAANATQPAAKTSRRRPRTLDEPAAAATTPAAAEHKQPTPAHTASSPVPRSESPTSSANRVSATDQKQPTSPAPRRGLGGFLKRARPAEDESTADPTSHSKSGKQLASSNDKLVSPAKKSRFGGWLRRAKDNDEAEEYRKVVTEAHGAANDQKARQQPPKTHETKRQPRATEQSPGDESQPRSPRRWLPKLSRPKLPRPKLSLPKLPRPSLKLPKFSRTPAAEKPQPAKEKSGFWSRLKLPSFNLSALKLHPPDDEPESTRPTVQRTEMRPVDISPRQLPGTDSASEQDEYFDDEEQDGRPLSKAERKRLRRNQQQRRSA